MIRTFRSKSLADLWNKGSSRRIDARMLGRIKVRLSRLAAASAAQDMNLPGFDFHELRGFRPTRYMVHVNGPWCVTFEFRDGDAYAVDLEQYH